MTLPDIPESQSPNQQCVEEGTSSQAPRYQLRMNRTQQYKCGTCGSRNCSWVQLVTSEPPDIRLALGAAIPARELSIARAPEHPQYEILTIQTRRHELEPPPKVCHLE